MVVRAMLAFAVDWLDSPNARQLGMRSSAASIMRHSLLELQKASLLPTTPAPRVTVPWCSHAYLEVAGIHG